MKWLFRTSIAAVGALVATAGGAVATAIWLMFAEGDAEGRRLGFFGAVFVEVQQSLDGTTQLGAGIAQPLPLILSVVVVTGLILAVFATHDALLERKRQLLAGADRTIAPRDV
ncbi:hypothetical protein [Microbacterium sp. NPDC089695]|uniref:hypothetical protein n=1 Tax=Microbacterium sp. NPDC089695 TaxID=3364198 RepID=UPI0038152B53